MRINDCAATPPIRDTVYFASGTYVDSVASDYPLCLYTGIATTLTTGK